MADLHTTPTIRRLRRSRRLRMSVQSDGTWIVTVPWRASQTLIDSFIKQNTPWALEKIAHALTHKRKYVPKGNRKDFLAYKKLAHALADARLKHFNQTYNFTYGRISIRNTKSRWGSCSKKYNLNFNYQIATLPPHLADYIIVHELCHCGEFNHSKKFWTLVARTIPDYKQLKREILSPASDPM
jgi:predicted metal-dependent hydrolase